MIGHHPERTAWCGHFVQLGQTSHMQFDSLVIDNRAITGGGTDQFGEFVLEGTKRFEEIKFAKKYVKPQPGAAIGLVYEGIMIDTDDGQEISGNWKISGESDDWAHGEFRLLRSFELERQRDAAFRMVVARQKMAVGLIRLVFEDIGLTTLKLLYLVQKSEHLSVFTLVSAASGFCMAILGPLLDYRTSKAMADAAGSVAKTPPRVDGGRDQRIAKSSESGYAMLTGEQVETKYQLRVESARGITRGEFLSGNLDYVNVLMEKPEEPAEVPDVSITDVIATSTGVRIALLVGVSIYWCFTITLPLTANITCNSGVPSAIIWAFMAVAMFNLFVQVWCAALTKYGYLILANAPQVFAFYLGVSLLGLFNSYSNMVFIILMQSCGSSMWKPAALIYGVGVILMQALPGVTFFAGCFNLPMALKFTQMNLLVALLKPSAC